MNSKAALAASTTWVLGTALLLTACREQKSAGPPPLPTNAVAMVGSQPITATAFQSELIRRAQSASGKFSNPEAKQAVLDELIRFEALHQRALAAGYDKDPQIAASLKRLIVSKFQEDQIARLGQPKVTPEEIADWYQRHPERFGTPEKFRAAIIELNVPRTAAPEQRLEIAKKAEAILAEARATAASAPTFGLLAQRHSEHQPSRYRGGDIGWFNAGLTNSEWPAAVLATLFKLTQTGQISPVIETPAAFYLVKLSEKQPAKLRPLSEVQDGIAYLVRREKENQQREDLYTTVKQGLPIQINQPLLDTIAVPAKDTSPPAMPGGITVQARREP